MNRINIVPKGIIKSGFANYQVLDGGRKVEYHGELVYKLGPFQRKQGFNKTLNFPTNVLNSEKFRNKGTVNYDRLTINVISTGEQGCEVNFDCLDQPVYGHAFLAFAGDVVYLERCNISFGWNGLSFNADFVDAQ